MSEASSTFFTDAACASFFRSSSESPGTTAKRCASPRDPGAVLAVNERGDVAGSVSGGCVESAVYDEAQDAIATGRPRLVSYGISDADAISVGLTCGGTIHVFIERLDW